MGIGNSAPFSYSMLDCSTNLPLQITEVEEETDLGVQCTRLETIFTVLEGCSKSYASCWFIKKVLQTFSS